MSLHLHLATRTDVLADGLAAVLARPLDDPFAEEFVVVPAKGVERWLTQRLSGRLGVGDRGGDGVCAGVRFLNPRSLVALLTGAERDDPWDPDRTVWPLLEVIDASLDEPWCATVARHLGHVDPATLAGLGDHARSLVDLRRDRRYSVARRLAGLFAAYGVQRPALLTDWAQGRDTDGAGNPLDEDLRWQPELWRRLVAAVPHPAPDRRHADAVAAIEAGAPLALPDRLSMFGHTRLPVTELELLRAVGTVREVHLWLPQPSPTAWEALAPHVEAGTVRRVDDLTGRTVRHPLLSSLGRDARELQRSLGVLGTVDTDRIPAATAHPATLLGWLQADLRDDRVPDPATLAGRLRAAGDRSVQVHACHGPMRQVEVLREVLVGLLEDDPTLEPRDVVVMCPDVEAYAPLFSAVFGLATAPGQDAGHPGQHLRVRLADRGLGSTNPLLALALGLVTLAGGRGTASDVLDLVASEPVRHRFRLADDDLATLTGWVDQSGIRWGLDQALRAPYRLEAFPQNTWEVGIDRLLLGVAMSEDGGNQLGGRLPLDDVGSAAVDLAARLAEIVARLRTAVERLQDADTVAAWAEAVRESVLDLGSVPQREAWQVAQFESELETVLADHAGGPAAATRLALADVRTLLELRLEPRPTRANFRTGHLTVCTMVPMRSVPHRVVCLVGLDDGTFPRVTTPDGDDVLARDPLTGERSLRSEDRQLLLDAVLAAGEHLVLTYTGANEQNGQLRPPAVPVGELLDALERTATGADAVHIRHPLQPFDPRNFSAGELGAQQPFSFDAAGLAGARAASGPRHPRPPLLAAPLPAEPRIDVELAALQSFVAHPVRGFLRQRLDVGVPADFEEVSDAIPVELDALEQWAVGDRILRRALAGDDPQAVFTAELLRGQLPPRELGNRVIRDIVVRVQGLYAASAQDRGAEPRSVDVTVDLGGGRRLTGVVPDVRGNRIVRVHYSNLGPKHRLATWLDLLALSCARPDHAWTAVTYGWHRTGRAFCSVLPPLDHNAPDLLRDIVDLYDRGLREPLPLPLKVGHAWAEAIHAHKSTQYAVANSWSSSDRSPVPGEDQDPAHVRVYGRAAPPSVLTGPAAIGEDWNNQPHRLGRYAVRLWEPLLSRERVVGA